jgi:hypothetical protein
MENEPKPSSNTIDQGNTLDDEEIQKIVELYEAILKERTDGPQLEGLEGARLAEALRNEPGNVVLLDLLGEHGEVVGKWPLLVPIAYHQDYSQKFFKSHYDEEPVYFFSLPPYGTVEELEAIVESPDGLLDGASDFLCSKGAIVTYDYKEGTDAGMLIPAFLETMLAHNNAQIEDITPDSVSEAWKMNYGQPKVIFYEGRARLINRPEVPSESIQAAIAEMIADGEIDVMPENGRTFVSAEQLQANDGELMEQMWDMYDTQFNILVEDHPALFQQPKEEFIEALMDANTINVAYTRDGKPVGLIYPMDKKKCVWLNPAYYDEKYGDDDAWLAFYTGVVVAADMAQKDTGFIQEMMNTVARVIEKTGKDSIVAFACSNISKTYIPKITETFIESNYRDEERRLKYPKRMTFDRDENGVALVETATYSYHVARVSPIED